MDAERIAEIRARYEAATPRPWAYTPAGNGNPSDGPTCYEIRSLDTEDPRAQHVVATTDYDEMGSLDADLIAHAPTDIEDLLAEVERLTSERDALAETVERVRDLHRESRGAMSALYPMPICECGQDYPCPTVRALDGEDWPCATIRTLDGVVQDPASV